ncbi:MAG: winged helix-turn-helix domain-containing protein [Anaerolineae bacterium]|nr:winged helix-turn-helix domain-containing protein [Anaerolineae bacterium]
MATASRYKESSFPVDYRAAEVGQIMSALYRQRSIAVTGLAGMGKSNVVRFIVSHPDVRSRYLQERADDYAFLHVDCAGLVVVAEAEILGEIAVQLPGDRVADLPRDARDVWRILKERVLDLNPDLNLVIVLDYFDEAVTVLDRSFFNRLFHLRNARSKGNLSYVFVTRRPLGSLYELQELLDDECAITPLGREDALVSIRRDEARLGCTFDAAQRDKLIVCTGGHPGFLKNACELLGSGRLDAGLPDEAFVRQLLDSGKVRNLCRELWDDLTPAEQSVLLKVVRGSSLPENADGGCVTYLERSGVLVREGGRTRVFCPLFETFVCGIGASTPCEICVAPVFPNQARIETPAGEAAVDLSPKLFALLAALSETRGDVLTTDDLIRCVYGDEALGVTNAALSQLVKRLRAAVDPYVRRLIKDQAYTCVETVRDVGYKLNG